MSFSNLNLPFKCINKLYYYFIIKPTAFDPRSTKLDPVSFMDQLKAGLQQHASSAVILQILPQVPVEVTEQEVTEIVSNDKCLDLEEEVVAVEVNTISELRDAFQLSKGLDCSKTGKSEEQLPQKTVGRQSDDSRPTVGRLLVACQ